jgi:hypothetical protein
VSVEFSLELVVTGRFFEMSGSAVAAVAVIATPPTPRTSAPAATIVISERGFRAIPLSFVAAVRELIGSLPY